jgi:hypothetical protein
MAFGVTALLFFISVFAKSWLFLIFAIALFVVCAASQLFQKKRASSLSEPSDANLQT